MTGEQPACLQFGDVQVQHMRMMGVGNGYGHGSLSVSGCGYGGTAYGLVWLYL